MVSAATAGGSRTSTGIQGIDWSSPPVTRKSSARSCYRARPSLCLAGHGIVLLTEFAFRVTEAILNAAVHRKWFAPRVNDFDFQRLAPCDAFDWVLSWRCSFAAKRRRLAAMPAGLKRFGPLRD